MAKKTKSTSDKPNRSTKDRKTLGSIRDLADTVVQSAGHGRAPYVDIPSRSLSNVRFNQSKRIIEMGTGTNRRELFNLAQARSYMQTLLVASGCKQLIDQGKTTSIRGLFYLLKHTIEGTSEETFDTRSCRYRRPVRGTWAGALRGYPVTIIIECSVQSIEAHY